MLGLINDLYFFHIASIFFTILITFLYYSGHGISFEQPPRRRHSSRYCTLYSHCTPHQFWESSTISFQEVCFINLFTHKRYKFPFRRPDILDHIVQLQSFENQFLPNALRKFFNETGPPNERNDYLSYLVDKFSNRFCECNPNLGFSKGRSLL
jgi:hypothetical protein